MKKVLLTGVTGFLGSHIAIQLLNKGYQVTGTLRNPGRIEEIKEIIAEHTSNIENLSFVQADLLDEKIWMEIAYGKDYIIHNASPFPRELPKDDTEIIRAARNGTLSVLRAASENGVKRVVLTSSSTAIAYGKDKGRRNGTFNESDWTDEYNTKDTTPYFRSKTIAEKAAWEYIANGSQGLELTSICPGAILGPVLEKDFGTSANIVLKTMDGSTPAIPKIGYEIADVRSVAELHILAMESPEAAGERFIGAAGFMSFKDVADVLREHYPDRKIPKSELPNVATRMISNFEKTIKPLLIDLRIERKLDNSKAKSILGWEPIPPEEAVIACAESLFNVGLLE